MMERAALSPAAAAALFPDPLLSASVYVSGRLCEVVDRLVAQRCFALPDVVIPYP
jgi:hypothetical protein